MKTVTLTAIASAAVMLLTACGKSDSSSSSEAEKSPFEGSWTVCDSDGFSSNIITMDFESGSDVTLRYTLDDLFINYAGTYELDGDKASVELHRISSEEELKKASNVYDDYEMDEEELAEMLSHFNEMAAEGSGEYFISNEDEKQITRTGDEHNARKSAYLLLATELMNKGSRTDLHEVDAGNGHYSIICSDPALNINANESMYDTLKELKPDIETDDEFSQYTQEEGFTENFSLDSHNWAMSFYDGVLTGVCLESSTDSSIYGTSALWYMKEDGSSEVLGYDESPAGVKGFVEFYSSLE
ncbi:MAG: hypothetical protein IJM55_05855 [Ruminococcus sp.]|nr:hypothetical protein [Ruminococcus sp.]